MLNWELKIIASLVLPSVGSSVDWSLTICLQESFAFLSWTNPLPPVLHSYWANWSLLFISDVKSNMSNILQLLHALRVHTYTQHVYITFFMPSSRSVPTNTLISQLINFDTADGKSITLNKQHLEATVRVFLFTRNMLSREHLAQSSQQLNEIGVAFYPFCRWGKIKHRKVNHGVYLIYVKVTQLVNGKTRV